MCDAINLRTIESNLDIYKGLYERIQKENTLEYKVQTSGDALLRYAMNIIGELSKNVSVITLIPYLAFLKTRLIKINWFFQIYLN